MIVAVKCDVLFGKRILGQIPPKYAVDLSAGGGLFALSRMDTIVVAKRTIPVIIADMTRMDNHQIFSVVGVGTVSVSCDNPAYSSVIKWKGSKMFSNENDWVSLVFVRAKGSGR